MVREKQKSRMPLAFSASTRIIQRAWQLNFENDAVASLQLIVG
jgi:hypothetical protein